MPVDSPTLDADPAVRARTAKSSSLLDLILQTTQLQSVPHFERFLSSDDLAESAAAYLTAVHPQQNIETSDDLLTRLTIDIGCIDRLLTRQLNELLHHPRLQKLEATWRGVHALVEQVENGEQTKIRLLNVTWEALVRDLDKAIEFDQSQLFRRVYSEEFDRAGGEPLSVLIGDYEVHLRPEPHHPTDDVQALQQISQVAAAAFAPFITGAHPALFGLDDFSELERITNLEGVFSQPEYIKWRSLRESDDSRFLGLTLPRVLFRRPWGDSSLRVDGFRFVEDCYHPSQYLWGPAVYAFAGVLIRAFSQSSWLADIRGVRTDEDSGGLVANLPTDEFETDGWGIAAKSSTDIAISEGIEPLLSDLGFMPLSRCHGTEWSAFYSNASVQQPKEFDRAEARANARLSAMLQYMLCVSRVAHYVKVLSREKIGSFMEASQCAEYLNNWLMQYVLHDDQAAIDSKAARPLREARVEVHDAPGRPGAFNCVIYLQPHYQFDDLASTFRLTTEMAPARR